MLNELNLGKNPFQNTTTRLVIIPKTDFLPIAYLPIETIFKTPSPTLQRPNLLQVLPPKRLFNIIPLIIQSSPTSVLGFKDILPQATLIRP